MLHTITLAGGAEVEGNAERVLAAAQLEINRLAGDLSAARRIAGEALAEGFHLRGELKQKDATCAALSVEVLMARTSAEVAALELRVIRAQASSLRTGLLRAVEEFRSQRRRSHCEGGPNLNGDVCGDTWTCYGCRRAVVLAKLIDDLQAVADGKAHEQDRRTIQAINHIMHDGAPHVITDIRVTTPAGTLAPEAAIAEGNPS